MRIHSCLVLTTLCHNSFIHCDNWFNVCGFSINVDPDQCDGLALWSGIASLKCNCIDLFVTYDLICRYVIDRWMTCAIGDMHAGWVYDDQGQVVLIFWGQRKSNYKSAWSRDWSKTRSSKLDRTYTIWTIGMWHLLWRIRSPAEWSG